jgi:hypothetical protein
VVDRLVNGYELGWVGVESDPHGLEHQDLNLYFLITRVISESFDANLTEGVSIYKE